MTGLRNAATSSSPMPRALTRSMRDRPEPSSSTTSAFDARLRVDLQPRYPVTAGHVIQGEVIHDLDLGQGGVGDQTYGAAFRGRYELDRYRFKIPEQRVRPGVVRPQGLIVEASGIVIL